MSKLVTKWGEIQSNWRDSLNANTKGRIKYLTSKTANRHAKTCRFFISYHLFLFVIAT